MKPKQRRILMFTVSLVLAAIFLIGGLALAATAVQITRLTSGATSAQYNNDPHISADGMLVAFWGDNDLLNQGISDGAFEVWLYDLATLTVTRITTGTPSGRVSGYTTLSGDGNRLAFISNSDFHSQGIGGGEFEYWLYDVQSDSYTRVTTDSGSLPPVDSPPYLNLSPSLNYTGTRIAFNETYDYRSTPVSSLSSYEVWVYDTTVATYTRVTTASASGRDSLRPDISDDGNRIAFWSDSDFNSTGISDDENHIWWTDLRTPGVYTQVTSSTGASGRPSISGDGEWIAYRLGNTLYLYEVATTQNTKVLTPTTGRNASAPDLNYDGTRLTYRSNTEAHSTVQRPWVYDRLADRNFLLDDHDNAQSAYHPTINADGTKVAVYADEDYLDDGDISDGAYEIFLFEALPNLTLTKSDDPDPASAGQVLTYTLTADNDSLIDISGAALTDTYPADVSIYDTDGGADDGSRVSWTFDITAGNKIVRTLVVTVDKEISGTITNNAELTSTTTVTLTGTPTDKTAGDTDSEDTTVSKPVLEISKVADPDPAFSAHVMTYTITVTNTDTVADALGVVITDQYDSDVVVKDSDGGAVDTGNRQVVWSGLSVPANNGTVSKTLVVTVNKVSTGTILANTVQVDSSGAVGPQETIQTTVYAPEFSLKKVDYPDPVTVSGGEATLTYTLYITNDSAVDATNLTLTDTYDTNLTVIDAGGGTDDATNHQVVWDGWDLNAGDAVSYTLVVTMSDVASNTILSNKLVISSYEGSSASLSGIETTVYNVDTGIPNLSLVKTSEPMTATAGELLTYTLTITNSGAKDAVDSVITDALDGSVSFDWASDSGSESAGLVEWPAVTIAPGKTISRVVVVQVDKDYAGTLTNTARISSTSPYSQGGSTYTGVFSDSHTLYTSAVAPSLVLTKMAESTYVMAGGQLTYTIYVTNTSSQADATGVVVTDTLSSWASLSQATGATTSSTQAVWSGLTVPADDAISLTLVVSVSAQATADITNTVAVDSDQNVGDTTTISTPVQSMAKPQLTIHKNGPLMVYAHEPISYTLTVTNTGSVTATNLVITDTLPANASYLTGGTLVGNDVISFTVTELSGNNGTVQVTFSVTATQPITNYDYRVTADDNISDTGQVVVVTVVEIPKIYLPIIHKP